MTREEAIKILKSRKEEVKADGYIGFATALDIAIKALEQKPTQIDKLFIEEKNKKSI
jgi:HEAT repeat protein